MINQGLSHISDQFLIITVVLYSLAVLSFAADFAFGRRASENLAVAPARDRVPAGVAAAAAGVGAAQDAAPAAPASAGAAGAGTASAATASAGPARAEAAGPGGGLPAGRGVPSRWVRLGLAVTMLGVTAQVLGVIFRGFAVHRVPWGDMYEFVIAATCVAVLFFLGLVARYRAWRLGLFFMAPIVIFIGLAQTVIYTPAGPLVPALNSYWLAIHVTSITLASGTFVLAAVLAVVYLVAERHQRRMAAGEPVRNSEVFRLLPSPERIDQFAYRTVVFGFPLWTFGIMAGAIWADQAWGRYWGWDPTETWAFITWVVYACFLHARVTAGWRGRKAAYINLVGFGCLLFNMVGVSLFITGLHSYAGLN
jgi:cytochrome c-type biogenesis protein CcsB